MTSEVTQIVKAYEEANVSPSDIASDRELDVCEVKLVLAQFSPKYQRDIKGATGERKKELDFNDDQLEMANNILYGTMLSTDDDNLKTRLAKYIRDDKKGRKDVHLKNLKKLNINVSVFNQQMMRANASLEKSKQKAIGSSHIAEAMPNDTSNVTNINTKQPILEAEEVKN